MADNANGGAQNTGTGNGNGQETGQQQQQQQVVKTDPNTGGQPQAGAEKTYSFKENRADWIPPHRLSEVTTRTRTIEQERDALKQQLEQATARVQALAGVNPKNPQEAEAEELRGIIQKLFPKLNILDQLDEDKLAEILESASVARQSSNSTWERHAHGMLTKLDSEAAKVLGVAKLDEKQQKRLRRAFAEEGREAEITRQRQVQQGQRDSTDTQQGDNDFVARFERGDETLVSEFAADFLNGFIEPVRKSVTAQVTRFRPVPRGDRNRAPVVQGTQQQDLNTRDGFQKALLAARGQGGSNT